MPAKSAWSSVRESGVSPMAFTTAKESFFTKDNKLLKSPAYTLYLSLKAICAVRISFKSWITADLRKLVSS